MNRRRKVGSTFLLSSLAALSIVGMGLAASTVLAEGETSFGIHFNDQTTPETGKVEVSEETRSTPLNVDITDDGTTIAFANDIVFEYTPAEGTDLTNKTLSLDWTASFDPATFTDYFDVANTSGSIAPEATTLAADTSYTFILKKKALGITLKAGKSAKDAMAALGDSATVNLAYKVNATDEEVVPPVVEVTGITLDKTELAMTVGDADVTLKATVAPENATDKTVSWTSDHPEFATVTDGVVHAVAPGTATITAKAGEKTATCTVTVSAAEPVDPFADAIDVSVSEFLDATDREGKLYKLTGVIGEVTNTTYGNSTLYDKTTGESLTLFGLSGTDSALSESGDTWSFANPKDYSTTVAGKFEAGDEIVMYGVYEEFNGTPEIMGVFDSVANAKADISYDVTVAEGIENGTVAVSATSGIYGTEITITATPAADYRIDTVKVNDKVVNPQDGVYKFNVLPGDNVVSASFVEASAPVTKFEITADKLGLGDYAAGNADLDTGAGVVSLSWEELGDYGNGIQWRSKNGGSSLWNTSELPYEIGSIQIVSSKSHTSVLNVAFSTSTLTSDQTEGTKVEYSADTVTVECDVAGAKFFRIDYASGGSAYIESIVINFVAE